jgi:hypothetical protein
MKKINSIAFTVILFLVLSFTAVIANVEAKPTLNLSFYKDNGYGMGNDMNGEWTINTEVSSDVQYVEFYMDDQLQLNDTSAPYNWNFNTGSYTEGMHTIKVVAYDAAGESATAERQSNFVGFPLTFVVGIIVFVVIAVIGGFGFALYRARKNEAKYKMNKTN